MKQIYPINRTSDVKDSSSESFLSDVISINNDTLNVTKARVSELKSQTEENGWFNGDGTITEEATPEDVQAAIDGAVSISGVFISENNTFNTDNHIENGAVVLDDPKIVTTNSLLNLENKINTLNKLITDVSNIHAEINSIKVLLYNIQHGTTYTSIDEIEQN